MDRPYKFKHVTARDYSILDWIYHARYATKDTVQVAIFTPTTESSCKTRLGVLHHRGFLKIRPPQNNHTPYVYFLGIKGRRYIAQKYSLDLEYVNKVSGVNSTAENHDLFMEHDLALGSIYAHATKQARDLGLELDWKNSRMLEVENKGVQPDAWIALSRNQKFRSAYIEFTRVLPTGEEWKRKIEGYSAVLGATTPILWFTTTQAKVNAILKAVAGSSIESNVLVGLYENRNGFVTSPMWSSPSKPAVSWLNLGGVGVSTPSPVQNRTTLSPEASLVPSTLLEVRERGSASRAS